VANVQACTLFGLNNSDLGTQLQDMEIGKLFDSWAFMKQLERDLSPLTLKNRERVAPKDITHFDIHIIPISDANGKLLGANLTFIDITRCIFLENQLQCLNSQLAKVTQELQDTKEQLHTTNIKLESTQKDLESLDQEMQFRRNL
jgi:two-component system CheB/CheR fusion protein